jgi:mono/diheme cytochrome c family protein
MKSIKHISIIIFAIAIVSVFMAFITPQDQKKGEKWDIPEKYQTMVNSYAGDASLKKIGKMLYSKHCKSCHGSKGLGDGSKAAQLDTFPGDFSSAEFKEHTPGDMYYMTYVGRDEMESFEKKISDEEDQWAVIMYLAGLQNN